MILRAEIVALEHGTRFTDGKDRVTIHFDDADAILDTLRFPAELLRRGGRPIDIILGAMVEVTICSPSKPC